MTIRKTGTEPAKTQVRPEDNDAETLSALAARGAPLPQELQDTVDRMANDPNYGVRRERPLRKTRD